MHRKRLLSFLLIGPLFLSGLFFACRPAAALDWLFTDGPTLAALRTSDPAQYARIRGGMDAAAADFSAIYTNPVTVRLTVDLLPGLPALMATGVNGGYVPYASLQAALPDLPALPPAFAMGDSLQRADSSLVYLTTAQMAATGVFDTPLRLTQSAGSLYLSTTNQWDFDPGDGTDAGAFDFVGIGRHELGHLNGFISAVDGIGAGQTGVVNPSLLDLYRFSSPGVRSFWGETYFSSDGGDTPIQYFEPGLLQSGTQGEHWRSLGETMSVFAVAGMPMRWTEHDEKAFSTWLTPKTQSGGAGAGEPGAGGLCVVMALVLSAISLRRLRDAR